MGSLFSTQDSSSPEAPAASVKGEKEETLKEAVSPTKKKRDGRSYAEVVRSGPETDAMSKLSKSGVAWEFCETQADDKVSPQERVQVSCRHRQGTG